MYMGGHQVEIIAYRLQLPSLVKPSRLGIIQILPARLNDCKFTTLAPFRELFEVYETTARKKGVGLAFWERKDEEHAITVPVTGEPISNRQTLELLAGSKGNVTRKIKEWAAWNGFALNISALNEWVGDGNRLALVTITEPEGGFPATGFSRPLSIRSSVGQPQIHIEELSEDTPFVIYVLSERSLDRNALNSRFPGLTKNHDRDYRINAYLKPRRLPDALENAADTLRELAVYTTAQDRGAARPWVVNRFVAKKAENWPSFSLKLVPARY